MASDPIVNLRMYEDLQRRCQARVRLFGFLWHVRCGGGLRERPSAIHVGRVYSVCQRCGDVTWPKQPGVPS